MIKQIIKYNDFLLEKQKLSKVYKSGRFFPDNVFCYQFKYIIAFEFDWHVGKEFYDGIIKFLKNINQPNFTFYILNPSAEDYYYKEFGVYGIGVVSIHNTHKDYIDFLSKPLFDGKEYTGEDIELASNDIFYFSDNLEWCIYGARNWEIAIVAFQNKEISNLFLDSFEENKDIFISLSDRIEDLNNMFHFNENTAQEYSVLLNNYKSYKNI